MLSKELALTCCSVTVLLWAVALRYGGFTRKAQRAYQDGLAETNQVCLAPQLKERITVFVLQLNGWKQSRNSSRTMHVVSPARAVPHPGHEILPNRCMCRNGPRLMVLLTQS